VKASIGLVNKLRYIHPQVSYFVDDGLASENFPDGLDTASTGSSSFIALLEALCSPFVRDWPPSISTCVVCNVGMDIASRDRDFGVRGTHERCEWLRCASSSSSLRVTRRRVRFFPNKSNLKGPQGLCRSAIAGSLFLSLKLPMGERISEVVSASIIVMERLSAHLFFLSILWK